MFTLEINNTTTHRPDRRRLLEHFFALFLKATLIILLLAPHSSFAKNTLNVVIVTSANSDLYTIVANNIETILNNNPDSPINSKTISLDNIYSEIESLQKTTDLFVPIGKRALAETLQYSDSIPILATLISEYSFKEITRSFNKLHKYLNIGAIYIDQPIDRILKFSRLTLPFADVSGFIVSKNNKAGIDSIKKLTTNKSRHLETINPGDNVIRYLSLALERSNVIIALPDPIVFNPRTTRNILLSTYRKRVPVIGFSNSYVKAGALAAIYSTPEFIGKQTGEVILGLSLNDSARELPILHSRYYSVSVNNRVSRSLGLTILDAEKLKKEMQILEGQFHD